METYEKEIVNKAGKKMIGLYNSATHKWIKWMPQKLEDPGSFVIHFGKHSGRTLAEIARLDMCYLGWLSLNCSQGSVARRCGEYLLSLTLEREGANK